MNPVAVLSRKLRNDTRGLPIFALVVLSLLYFFDEFDTAAFGTLAPDIEKSFHLTDQKFVSLVVINVSLVLLLAIPVGYLADRIRRTPLVVLSGILAGTCSLATGLVGSVVLLTVVRFGNGLGLLANGPIHNSLLADYYPPESRPAVYGDHGNALQVGAIIGPAVAGIVAAVSSWQVAFMVLIVPIVLVSLLATRLGEPRRGGTDDPEAAVEAEAEAPVPFKEGARTLWAVKTLRRQFWSALVLGAGLLPLAGYLPLYFQRVYHLGPASRGAILAASAASTFAGIRWAGRVTPKWFAQGMGQPLKWAGLALAAVGVSVSLVAVSPNLVLAVAIALLAGFSIGVYTPPYYAVQALVSPARVRTLSFSFGAMFLVGGVAVLFYAVGLSTVSDSYGIRWGVFVLGPYWVIAGAILASSARYVASDAAAALKTLSATVELRRQRLKAGERSLLLCSGVDVAYSGVQVLFDVDLEVKEGELIALLGTNGAGKSTLLKAISGLVDPVGGAIFFDGNDVTHADPLRACRLGIVQMPGGRSIFPSLTVDECLRLAGWMYKRQDPKHVRRATETVLGYFPVLHDRGDQLAGNLSGGEQQMLGLGMAFIAKPRLLMIDELTLGLAPTIVGNLIEIVRSIHQQGTTVILVEQSVNVALTMAQRAVFMEKGEVRFTGPTADLLEREDVLRSVFLEGASARPGASPRPGATPSHADATSHLSVANGKVAAVPQAAKDQAPAQVAANSAVDKGRSPPEDAPVLLQLDGVVKHFGGITAVDNASFAVYAGEVLGLIGPNGAGKTTVFDLISGFLTPDAGRIMFCGKDVTGWSPDRRARAGFGRSFQDARLFGSLSVAENIAVALERHLEVRDPLATALGLPEVAESETDVAWTVHELIELLGLDAYRNKFVSELSTGSRRIVDLAMAIAHEPSLLILDEPSSGIAQRETEALGPLLLRILEEVGCSLLVIEHDMPLITGIAHRIAALESGRVIAVGPPTDVVNHPAVIASYLGADSVAINRSGAATLGGTGNRKPRRAGTR